MKIIHGGGFSIKEKEEAVDNVISNLLMTIYIIMCQKIRKTEFTQHVLLELVKDIFMCFSNAEEK